MIAAALGQPFMPWQAGIADIAGELDPVSGYPAYDEVFTTVPRQSGKTVLFVAWQIHRCISPRWRHPQRSVFTAQSGKDARDKWLDELYPLIRNSKLFPLVEDMNRGMGNESIKFKTGSNIRLLSTSSSAGHSKTLDQAVLDEIWHDEDDRREQGLRPTMNTRPDPQMLVCSTAGTAASTVYNRKVVAGRQAVTDDLGFGMCYFEWSAPPDWNPEDESTYADIMPAVCPSPPCQCDPAGRWRHTITARRVVSARQSMELPEFLRAYGNIPTIGKDLIVPPENWMRVCNAAAKPKGKLRFALDVADDRSSAAISAYGGDVVELVDHRPGTGWVVERANELLRKHGGVMALDYGGPAGVLADGIDRTHDMTSREVVQACGAMYDAIMQNRVTFRTDPALDAAVEGAVKKSIGDNWVWSRKASLADVTPIMSATLAARGLVEPEPFAVFE